MKYFNKADPSQQDNIYTDKQKKYGKTSTREINESIIKSMEGSPMSDKQKDDCHCLEALRGGKHHAHCSEQKKGIPELTISGYLLCFGWMLQGMNSNGKGDIENSKTINKLLKSLLKQQRLADIKAFEEQLKDEKDVLGSDIPFYRNEVREEIKEWLKHYKEKEGLE